MNFKIVSNIFWGTLALLYTSEHGINWIILVLVTGIAAFMAGYHYVDYLRRRYKASKQNKWVTMLVFIIPIAVFVICSILSFTRILEKKVADSLSFGTVAGVLIQLSSKPKGKSIIKVIIQQVNGKSIEIWLDSLEETVGEVKVKVAEALDVHVNRICFESGKGSFIEDMSKVFAYLIDDSLKSTDFFGFITMSCYFTVKEEEATTRRRVSIFDEAGMSDRMGGTGGGGDKKSNIFSSMMMQMSMKQQIKYGDPLQFTCKIAMAIESKAAFNIAAVDKFAAAAPASIQMINMTSVRLHSWDSLSNSRDVLLNDGASDAGGTTTERDRSGSAPPTPNGSINGTKPSPSITFRKSKKVDYFGKPVRNGDLVILECNGKFMSVARGWWLAWSSHEPRRSGAFVLEIIERAQSQPLQNRFKEQIESIKGKMGVTPTAASSKLQAAAAAAAATSSLPGDVDQNILRPGDMFRLTSVKFPAYELGLTSVKVRDEYCYLGLRQHPQQQQQQQQQQQSVQRSQSQSQQLDGEDNWSMEVLFSLKGYM